MATHSSIFAWKIPWTEEPSRLQSMGLQELDMTVTKPPPRSTKDKVESKGTGTYEPTYKTKTGSQIQRADLWLSRERGEGEGWTGSLG